MGYLLLVALAWGLAWTYVQPITQRPNATNRTAYEQTEPPPDPPGPPLG